MSTASMTSSALPTARPSGWSMSVMSAVTLRFICVPMPIIVRARARESSSRFMKAPLPVFTSSTSASMPSASFLLMMELAISGRQSTVAVTSRSA